MLLALHYERLVLNWSFPALLELNLHNPPANGTQRLIVSEEITQTFRINKKQEDLI
jgi:hypothetical protein